MKIHPNEAKSHEYGWTRNGVEEYCSPPCTERLAVCLVEALRKEYEFSEEVSFFTRLNKEWA